MEKIKINIFHTGKVLVSKYLPFGGYNTNLLKASGIFSKKMIILIQVLNIYFLRNIKFKMSEI